MKYGRLRFLESLSGGMWKMMCDCGNEHVAYSANIKKGATRSCGCLRREVGGMAAKTHGMSQSAEYMTWNRMWSRCTNPIVDRYPQYGGRGISVCKRWEKFENFLQDVGMKPSKMHSLGRIDNDGDYEPNNVRWESPEQQRYNTTKTVKIECEHGSITLLDAAKLTGQSRDAISQRLRAGMPIDKVLSSKSLQEKPITVNGQTKLRTEWMRDIPIPISSFYLYLRRGMTPEQVVEKYIKKTG